MRRERVSGRALLGLQVMLAAAASACGGESNPGDGGPSRTTRSVTNPTGDCATSGDGSRPGHSPDATDVYLSDCGSTLAREYYRVFVKADDTAYMFPRPDGPHTAFVLPCRSEEDPLRPALDRYSLCQEEPLSGAQVEVVNAMEPADALGIAHALNDQLVFFVGASGVEPPVFAGDVLELCKADAGFRAGLLKERCDFELDAEASGVRNDIGWVHTGEAGLVLASALNALYGIEGDEMCLRLRNDASLSLSAVIEGAARPCTTDADCTGIAHSSDCHDACGRVIAASRTAEVTAARAVIEAEQCVLFERGSCTLLHPPCEPPGEPACVSGVCEERY